MQINGKEYKYSAIINYSHNDNYDTVPINEVKIIDNDLYLYSQALFYPGVYNPDIKLPKGYDIIVDCLIVLKNYKVVSEYFKPILNNKKNKLYYFFNPKAKKKLLENKGKINCPLFNSYFREEGAFLVDAIEYDASKKELTFKNGSAETIDNKHILGVDYIILKCDEITYYWNEWHSYITGKRVDID